MKHARKLLHYHSNTKRRISVNSIDDHHKTIMQSNKPPSEENDHPQEQETSRWGKRELQLIIYCYETLCSWPLFLHLVMVVSLVWVSGFVQYNFPLVTFVAILYLHKVDSIQKERLRIRIQSDLDERRSRSVLSTDAETVVWLNTILQECWPAWLERYLSHLIVNYLHLNLAYYKPKALSKLVIDYLRLGSSPPTIQFAKVHRNGNVSRGEQAVLELDIVFVTAEDMKLELIARLKKASMGLGLAGKLYGNNLRVEGKLRLGLKFVPFYPYLGQLTIAFATVPILGLSVRPLSSNSVDVTDLPGIASWVSRAIQASVEAFLVEPHPLVVDLIKLCGADYRFDVDKDGTFCRGSIIKDLPKDVAFVILEILECKDLECKDRTGYIDPYVKITLDKVKFKTSIKKQTAHPIWHELFRLRINSWGPPSRLLLRVRDRDVFGKDDELGGCLIDINQLRGGKRHDMWMKLHGVKSGQIHVAATVVDSKSRISGDYDQGSTSTCDTAYKCTCNKENIILDDSVALRAKMKQIKVPPCMEHPPSHNIHGRGSVDDAASSSSRPSIRHVRVASVDSDRFEGSLVPRGLEHSILEKESLSFPNGPVATLATDIREASVLPSVAEKLSARRWEAENITPSKTRKRRTFMFLKPRSTIADAQPSLEKSTITTKIPMAFDGKQINSIPSKSYSRMNFKSLYKRMSSEFRSPHDDAQVSSATTGSIYKDPITYNNANSIDNLQNKSTKSTQASPAI